jgi:hypothetical protein
MLFSYFHDTCLCCMRKIRESAVGSNENFNNSAVSPVENQCAQHTVGFEQHMQTKQTLNNIFRSFISQDKKIYKGACPNNNIPMFDKRDS